MSPSVSGSQRQLSFVVAGWRVHEQRGLHEEGVPSKLRRVPGAPALAAIAAAGGLVHGYAYGEAVIGAETTPLLAYLTGLALTQTAMLAAAWFAARQVPAPLSAISERLSRAIGLLVGAFALWSGAALFA